MRVLVSPEKPQRLGRKGDDETESSWRQWKSNVRSCAASWRGGGRGGGQNAGHIFDDGLDQARRDGVALAVEALAGVEALAVAVVHGLGERGTVAFGAIVEGKAGQRAAVGLGELAGNAARASGVASGGAASSPRNAHGSCTRRPRESSSAPAGTSAGGGEDAVANASERASAGPSAPPRAREAPTATCACAWARRRLRRRRRQGPRPRRLARRLGRWTPTPATTHRAALPRSMGPTTSIVDGRARPEVWEVPRRRGSATPPIDRQQRTATTSFRRRIASRHVGSRRTHAHGASRLTRRRAKGPSRSPTNLRDLASDPRARRARETVSSSRRAVSSSRR